MSERTVEMPEQDSIPSNPDLPKKVAAIRELVMTGSQNAATTQGALPSKRKPEALIRGPDGSFHVSL
jgi:hypothetical protein